MEIQGYPNYLIYEDGRVFTKKYNKFLKPSTHQDGYKQVVLGIGVKNKSKTIKIHRLVAIHYIPNPENKPEVDHINQDPSDNRVENLRWVTSKENSDNRRTIMKTNKSGHKHISYHKQQNRWIFIKVTNKVRVVKYSKSKIIALCHKFIFILKQGIGSSAPTPLESL
tara:strand:+ start:58 stop:558 length:501 start_codon:yes stop_codon:yes gene_type:complete